MPESPVRYGSNPVSRFCPLFPTFNLHAVRVATPQQQPSSRLSEMPSGPPIPVERSMQKIRRRTRMVGAFPDGNAALLLVATRLRHSVGTRWGTKQYMNLRRLHQKDDEEA